MAVMLPASRVAPRSSLQQREHNMANDAVRWLFVALPERHSFCSQHGMRSPQCHRPLQCRTRPQPTACARPRRRSARRVECVGEKTPACLRVCARSPAMRRGSPYACTRKIIPA
jgi:hypothetical protein